MKVLIAGLGSIGQRHVRNLRRLLGDAVTILAWRTQRSTHVLDDQMTIHPDTNVEHCYNLQVFFSMEEALRHQPDIVFVTNPTSLHLSVALVAAEAGCHLFIEKPLSHSLAGLERLTSLVEEKALCVMVGFQFRFHPGLRLVKRLLLEGAIGPVVSAHAHWGEYLPGWHPWEDYRQSYSARAVLGGGVILTLCHPFDYLRWLLGEVQAVSTVVGYTPSLELDVEDTASITLRFESGVIGAVHLNYIQRPPSHWLHIIGQAGTIQWDAAGGAVRCYRADRDEWEVMLSPPDFERNTMFLDEMHHFLDCIAGRTQPLVTLEDGIRTLKIALAAKRSAVAGRVIEVCDD
jgi:predicted dehydrogenase